MRSIFALLSLLQACATDPCAALTPQECGEQSTEATSWRERASLAARSCELGSGKGCTVLGLQLLLNSEPGDPRYNAAQVAFSRSCNAPKPYLCMMSASMELTAESPDWVYIANRNHRLCVPPGGSPCVVTPELRRRAGERVSEEVLQAAIDRACEGMGLSIELLLDPNGRAGQRVRYLMSLPRETTGNLWILQPPEEWSSFPPIQTNACVP